MKAGFLRPVFSLGATLLLLWRVVDFVSEAATGAFHMTRVGLALQGTPAEVTQLAIIALCGVLASVAWGGYRPATPTA